MDVEQRVRQFILDTFYVSDPAELVGDTSLVAGGIVDSTGVLEILAFLEAELGVRVSDEETIPENLESIERIAAFVERKRRASSREEPATAAATGA